MHPNTLSLQEICGRSTRLKRTKDAAHFRVVFVMNVADSLIKTTVVGTDVIGTASHVSMHWTLDAKAVGALGRVKTSGLGPRT